MNTIVTEMGVFKWIDGKFTMVDLANGVTVEEVKAATGCDFVVLDSYEGY